LSSMVVMVAVVTLRRTSNTAEFIADLVHWSRPGMAAGIAGGDGLEKRGIHCFRRFT
jgi:hypothetical protein